jgi:hypothetical protein
VRDPIVLAEPRPGVTPERIADNSSARAWFSAEHAVLLAAIDRAAGTGFDTHVWQLARSLVTFRGACGRSPDLRRRIPLPRCEKRPSR